MWEWVGMYVWVGGWVCAHVCVGGGLGGACTCCKYMYVSVGLGLACYNWLLFPCSMNDNTDFYNGDCMLPVYKWSRSKEHYPLETLAKLLITDAVPSSNICSKQPVRVCRNVSFVVDVQMLDDPLDIRADENGTWRRKGSPIAYISMHTNKEKTRFFRRTKAPTRSNHYKITRTHYRHASSPDFTRIITVVHGEILNIHIHVYCVYWLRICLETKKQFQLDDHTCT